MIETEIKKKFLRENFLWEDIMLNLFMFHRLDYVLLVYFSFLFRRFTREKKMNIKI